MRKNCGRNFSLLVVLVYFIIFFVAYKIFLYLSPTLAVESVSPTKPPVKHISKLTTIVIRDFELQDNDVTGTVQSFLKVFPNIQILIFTDGIPYPPLTLNYFNDTFKNVKVINLLPNFNTPYQDNPLTHIKTNYVLFVPDSTRILHRQSVQQMINYLSKENDKIVVVPYTLSRNLTCVSVNITLKDWTLRFTTTKGECDLVTGKHAAMVKLSTLYKLNNPLLLPHPHSMYLQSSYFKFKVKILHGVQFQDGKPLYHSHYSQRQKMKSDQLKYKKLYSLYSIKHVIKENGAVENYGCNRDTPRCFGSVINYTPSYIYENKTTPPCCLENLRKTARHVFNILQEAGIRYWLDSGSLLGAMRNADVIPWDYDVDIGFNRDDFNRCIWLRKAKNKPVMDIKGFYWEKATEGNFYRVHFSKVNRVNVNLFPFYTKNGTMVKDAWFTSHKYMEFPDHYLHPMSSIEFVGKQVASPNNIRDFLEYKFGKGVIENRQYPDFKNKFT